MMNKTVDIVDIPAFKKLVRKKREEAGFSSTECAKVLGVSPQAYSGLESTAGKQTLFKLANFLQLCIVLNMDARDFAPCLKVKFNRNIEVKHVTHRKTIVIRNEEIDNG